MDGYREFNLKNDEQLKKLKEILKDEAYLGRCNKFDFWLLPTTKSYDASTERQLKQLNVYAKLLNTEIYRTDAQKFTTGGKDGAYYMGPMYHIDKQRLDEYEPINEVNREKIENLIQNIDIGAVYSVWKG